jgi:hypothetical protein
MVSRAIGKRPKPKFRVGQVVAIIGMHPIAYEKVESVNQDAPSYQLDSGTFSDYELRPLTARERGT